MRLVLVNQKKLLDKEVTKKLFTRISKKPTSSVQYNQRKFKSSSSFSSSNNNNSSSFSSYEYPLRTEAPIISRTKSNEIEEKTPLNTRAPFAENNFDDDSLSKSQLQEELSKQHLKINTKLNSSISTLHEPLSTIPATISNSTMTKLINQEPNIELSTLPNGIQCITQESKNQPFVTSIGLFSNMGSRFETQHQTGLSQLMEILSFYSTKSCLNVNEEIQKLGGMCFMNMNRDQTMYCLDIVRNELDQGMMLFADSVLNGLFTEEEVEHGKMVLGYQWEDIMSAEMKLAECLMIAAYSQESGLGKWHYCPPEEIGSAISSQSVHDFRSRYFVPNEMVLSATGLSHSDLINIGTQYFGHLTPSSSPTPTPSPPYYKGGEYRLYTPHKPQHDNLTRVALAFELPDGWHNTNLVPILVLQTLLGGGNSFSAGGPGKGMYSRLYREILNRYHWVESSEAFTISHTYSGLFGIQGSTTTPYKSKDLIQVFMEHFYKCSHVPVKEIELARAKNMLKCNVLSQLESRLVIMEDLGRQMLTYGKRESIKEMCQKIDAVTQEDILRVSQEVLMKGSNVSLAVVGVDVEHVPSVEEIRKWF